MSTTDKLLAQMRNNSSLHYGNPLDPYARGKGIYIEGTDGVRRIDAASGYGADGFGHNHPRICELIRNLNTPDPDGWGLVNVVPNVHPTPPLGTFLSYACKTFGYERGLVTNGGVEAVEGAIKLMRKWGYTKKGVPKDKARIVVCGGNFHGRTTTVVGFSSEPTYRDNFGPYVNDAFIEVPYGDASALARVLEEDARSIPPTIVGFLVEPIQGEGGVRIPPPGYLQTCAWLCKKYNVILCADEIQTGLGRTGAMLASMHDQVKPDLVVLGKILGAGKYPVAMVLGNDPHMCFNRGDHGSTLGGNPLAMSIAHLSLQLLKDEKLCDNAEQMGAYLLSLLKLELSCTHIPTIVKDVRGRGLMIGIELADGIDASTIIGNLRHNGVMTKDAHHVIRLTPPLIITKEECADLSARIGKSFLEVALSRKRTTT